MKQKTALILTARPETFTHQALYKALQSKKIKTEFISPNEYQFDLLLCKKAPNYVFHRSLGGAFDDFDLRISERFSLQKSKIINPLSTIKTLRNKAEQIIFFNGQNIETLPTYFIRGPLSFDHFEKWAQGCDQFVIKTERGHRGLGTFKINGMDSLNSLWGTFATLQDQRFIIQPFYQNAIEFRVLILKSKIICATRKSPTFSPHEFRKNAHFLNPLNEVALPLKELPGPIKDMSKKIATLLEHTYLALDIFYDKKRGAVLIECNAACAFERLQKSVNFSLADLIIKNLD